MSSSNDQPPPTLKPKPSNSGIFSAIKTITGGRSRTTDQSVSSVDTPTSPLSSKSANLSDVLVGDTLHSEPFSLNGNAQPHAASIMGGPPELQTNLDRLNSKNLIAIRLKAVEELTSILKQYPIDNITKIWAEAKDLLQESMQDATDAAFALLSASVRHRQLTASERKYFFESIADQQRLNNFYTRFQILSELTSSGRNLEALELVVAPLVVRLLKQAYEAVKQARKQEKGAKSVAEKQLSEIFRYLVEIAKFSSRSLTDADLELIIDQVVAICNKTTSESDLENSVDLINAMTTYARIPQSSLRPCAELLCGIYCQIPNVKEKSWSAIENLLRSHLGPTATETLLTVLRENPYLEDRKYHSIRGTVLVFQQIFTLHEPELTLPAIPDLFSALKASLALESVKLESEVMLLILTLLQQNQYSSAIMENDTWSDFVAIVMKCSARKPEPKDNEADGDSLSSATASVGLQKIVERLIVLSTDMDFDQRHMVAEFMRNLSVRPNEDAVRFVTDHYTQERLLYPSNEDWYNNWHKLYDSLFKESFWSSDSRLTALQALLEAYNVAEALDNPSASGLVLELISRVREEPDPSILAALLQFAVDTTAWTSDESIFDSIVNIFSDILLKHENKSRASSPVVVGSFGMLRASISGSSADSLAAQIAKTLVRMFLQNINKSAAKAQKLYNTLLAIAESENPPVDARIITLKLLFRLRSDVNYALFVIAYTGCDDLAASLCRTESSSPGIGSPLEQVTSRTPRAEDLPNKRSSQPSSPSQLGRSGSQSRRVTSGFNARITKPVPPLWFYPGPKGLPEDPPATASPFLYTRSTKQGSADSAEDVQNIMLRTIKTGHWLELVLRLLQQETLHWELYSYIVVHLGAQLTNHSFFVDAIPQVRLLRSVVCQQLSNKTFHEPPSMTNLKRSDVAICVYDILTMLISYAHYFSKNEQDEMVKILVFGIGSWERTSECCIHALAICCHELPLSLSKSLENLLHKFSQIITQSQTAVHILEFLTGLARLPDLFKNFREDEFKLVFGICFRYLQYVRDQRDKAPNAQQSSSRPGTRTGRQGAISRDTSRDQVFLSEKDTTNSKTLSDTLPQYVYALTYHVMTFWYLSLKLQDRARQIPWIIRNLVYTKDGFDVMEEQAQVLVDMMHRVAYSDLDETSYNTDFAKPIDGTVSTKSWLTGMSIITLETASRSGVTQVIRRRPSGTRYSIYRPEYIKPPRHQIPLSGMSVAEASNDESHMCIMPDDIMQEFYSPLLFSSPSTKVDSPVLLSEDDVTRRAMESFDRISPLDGHKVGVVYIGENQSSESQILANVMGSYDFIQFLEGLGTLMKLKGASFNTQGLDREFDTDGEFTFAWRDRATEIIYHVTTMMPTNLEHDPNCTNKKRHTGNDFVNIIFDNSGLPFKFDTFPSDFNYVNIVITPEARASFVETRLQAERKRRPVKSQPGHETNRDNDIENLDDPELYYKVTVMTKPGIPRISPAADTKVISGRCLPSFVRLIALNASYFALEWANQDRGNEHVSSWRTRLREIMRLRDKFVADSHATGGIGITTTTSQGSGGPVSSTSGNIGSPTISAMGQSTNNRATTPNHAATPSTGSSAATTGGGVSLPPGYIADVESRNNNAQETRGDSALFRRASAATFLSDDNRSSGLSAANLGGANAPPHATDGVDMERTGSGRSGKSGAS